VFQDRLGLPATVDWEPIKDPHHPDRKDQPGPENPHNRADLPQHDGRAGGSDRGETKVMLERLISMSVLTVIINPKTP